MTNTNEVIDFAEWSALMDERAERLKIEREHERERAARRYERWLVDRVRFRSVGRKFLLRGGMLVEVVEAMDEPAGRRSVCAKCVFGEGDEECTPLTAYFPCSAHRRRDGRSVFFRELRYVAPVATYVGLISACGEAEEVDFEEVDLDNTALDADFEEDDNLLEP